MTGSPEQYAVLIVDRSSGEVDQLILALREVNLRVVLVSDGQKAFEACLKDPPHLIISELDLPLMDGEEFIRHLRTNTITRHIPVLITARESDLEKRLRILTLGPDDYVPKPYYPEEVAARAEVLLAEVAPIEAGRQQIRHGFMGQLNEMNLVDIIQTLEIGAKSGIVILRRGSMEGRILVREGQIIDAQVKNLPPAEALTHLFTWLNGSYWVTLKQVESQRRIKQDNRTLLIRGTELIQEWRQLAGQLPPLDTRLEASDGAGTNGHSEMERSLITIFSKPKTIFQGVEESQMDDLQALRLIKSLLDKGLFVRKSAEEASETMTAVNPLKMASKERIPSCARIFKTFTGSAPRTDESLSIDPHPATQFRTPPLTRAELMLIRNRLLQ